MRALLIDARKTGDWSLDLLFAGLVSNLGPENVIDFPSHDKHRMGKPKLVGEHEKDWGAERMSLSYVPQHASLKRWTSGEVMEELRRGKIDIIFLDERHESYELYLSLKANFFEVPVIVVAGHDKFWNESPRYVRTNYYQRNIRAMFLDNWCDDYNLLPNTHVYNWSTNFDHLWDPAQRKQEKLYDISFTGYNSHPDRARFVDHILSRWGHLKLNIVLERKPDSFGLFVNKAEYFKMMAQSKICLNLRGAAVNGKTLRFYEIPYAGSCMLSQDTGAVQVEPFENAKHCLYFANESELDDRIDGLLANDSKREIIAAEGLAHVLAKHTAHARVKSMLEKIIG